MEDFNNMNNEETKYTDNSFYTKKKEDIIQDEVKFEEPKTYYTPPTSDIPYSYKPPKQKKTKKGHSTAVVIIACVLAAVIGAVSGSAAVFFLKNETLKTNDPALPGTNVNINVDKTVQSVVEAVAEKVTPSVIGIRTTTSVMNFFGGSSESSGDGSGVVYSADGYIITNYHVISDAIGRQGGKIEVYLDSADDKAYSASVVGYNISADLAVIKIDAKGLTPIEFASSDELNVGQYVITVGNPGGLEFMDSVTYGVISGLNRVVSSSSEIELIQTDAAINPGNSGGALVNTAGKLVGINSSKIVSEEFEGMGFAIPSNTVKEICENIIAKQDSPEAYVGITISERYSPSVLEYYGYPVGAVVLSVAEGSPADEAGIERGDIITEFDGTQISRYQILENLIEQSSPGESVAVKIYRSGRYYSTTIKVGSNS